MQLFEKFITLLFLKSNKTAFQYEAADQPVDIKTKEI